MVETLAAAGIIGIVGSLWKIAMENAQGHSRFKAGIEAVIHELQLLRAELAKDIRALEADIKDHEFRLRDLEKKE